MSDPSASPPRSQSSQQQFDANQRWAVSQEQARFVREWFGGWNQPELLVVDEHGTLSLDDTLRCREQALHSASIMFDVGGQFPEDDAERVVAVAKRFEKFMRSGQ